MQRALSLGGKSKMNRRVSTPWEQVTAVGGGQKGPHPIEAVGDE